MQTGVISFCDRINYNIKSSDTKDEILTYLNRRYGIHVLQKHWFHLDDKGYDHMKRSPHWACLRSNGNPYYMCFMKYEDVPIVYFIDKKVQPGYQQPRILLGRGLWDESLFQNTVFDGEMVKDKYGAWVFLINDLIAYKGRTLQGQGQELPARLEIVFDILETMHTPNPLIDCCTYQVKQYATATKEGVDSLIQLNAELPYTSRGLYFWPHYAKNKPKLVNFDDNLIKSVVRKVKDVPDFREFREEPVNPEQAPKEKETYKEKEKEAGAVRAEVGQTVTWMRKTELPDVYDVFSVAEGNGGSNNKGDKIGTAFVPNMKVSKMMRSIFRDTTVAVCIKMIAEYQQSNEKWLPIRQA